MAFLEISNVKVAGLAACVPSFVEENVNVYKKWGGMNLSFLQRA